MAYEYKNLPLHVILPDLTASRYKHGTPWDSVIIKLFVSSNSQFDFTKHRNVLYNWQETIWTDEMNEFCGVLQKNGYYVWGSDSDLTEDWRVQAKYDETEDNDGEKKQQTKRENTSLHRLSLSLNW